MLILVQMSFVVCRLSSSAFAADCAAYPEYIEIRPWEIVAL